MQHRDRIVIQKVIKEMQIAIELLSETPLEQFVADEMMKRALCMTVINVGELVKVVSDDMREKHKSFPWKAVAGMRDITAHRYQTLRMEDVYNTICKEYPALIKQLEEIMINEAEV